MKGPLRLVPAIALAAAFFAAPSLAQDAKKPDNCKGAVPAELQPPGSPTVLVRAQAEGSQIYVCSATPAGGFAWNLNAPDAVLTDASGKPIGKQVAGPTWQANDGSSVAGEVVASAASPDAKDAPWLLFKATAHGGAGQFSKVRYIQRVNTDGGLPPAAACDATHRGKENRVKFFAVDMLFQ